MSKFRSLEHYEDGLGNEYQLLPFNFTALDDRLYALNNMAGEHAVLTRVELDDFVEHRLPRSSEAFAKLKTRHFLMDGDSTVPLDLLALKVRTKYERIAEFTSLHIFVVSLRCEHSCPYCQVSRQSHDRSAFDMSEDVAMRALDLVFCSPSPYIKIEFQGGESMLNFELVRTITLAAERRNLTERRMLEFAIATNLAVVTDEILEFCRDHEIFVSTSLDGPADLHNANRPRPGGDSHERAISGIQRARAIAGRDRVSALMTTTERSLNRVRDIIDEFIAQGFGGIFLRPLSPYGFAVKTKSYDAYDMERWLKFYFEGLDYIIELNRTGFRFSEFYASMILNKMLTPFGTGYMDLRSPAGIGIGAIVYDYNGDVYASDESRMLAQMHDTTFRLGNVMTDTWEDMMTSAALLDPLEASIALSAPMCSECAFEPYCGAEPVFHHATQGDFVGHKPTSAFCNRNMAIFRRLIGDLESRPDVRRIYESWIRI